MNILFTHGYFISEDEKELRIMKPYPPLGLQYISAYLEEKGWTNHIYDTTFSNFENFQQYLLNSIPDVLAIYTNLMTKLNVLKIIRWVKQHPELSKVQIVLGGPEVRHHALQFLQYGADFMVLGEGEASMLALVEYLASPDLNSKHAIPGIAFLEPDGQMTRNPEGKLIEDLDKLPFPNRNKIDQDQYFQAWKKQHGYSMITINTMRGCPYSCTWCSRSVFGKSYRRRSPENVVQEMLALRNEYQFDKIWFVDDVFTINHKWLRGFAAALKQHNLKIPYEAISRADRMNEEVIQLLKETGCFRIWIGAESGSQQILDAMKRMVKIEAVRDTVLLSKSYGLETGTFIMLGYPGETEKDIEQTRNYLIEAQPDFFTLTLAYPIKGTALYDEVESHFLKDLPWEHHSDRDIEFKRNYNQKYYDHAINWIYNEVYYYKLRAQKRLSPEMIRSRIKSLRARMGMVWQRILSLKNNYAA